MVMMPAHEERLADPRTMHARIAGFAKQRRPHLERLAPVEEMVRKLSPLPVSYEVSRVQPPYFHEFVYGEAMGALYLTPQSTEVACRLAQTALTHRMDVPPFDFMEALSARRQDDGTLDKYRLGPVDDGALPRNVAFLPGSNLFERMVSREVLTRAMYEVPDLMIKPHPLTDDALVRRLGREFGYHRILDPKASGWQYLRGAETAYVTSSSELGLYAALQGARIVNIGNFFTEAGGAFYPLFRIAAGKDRAQARAALSRAMLSPLSGLFWPGDPHLEERLRVYFDEAMALRSQFEPLAYDVGPVEWAGARAGAIHVGSET